MLDEQYQRALDELEKAKKVKDPEEIEVLLSEITIKQIEEMKKDFNRLKAFLNGEANKKDKLEKCQEFLNKHQDIPKSDETIKMFSAINNLVKTVIKETEDATGETRPIEPVKVSQSQDEPETGSVEIEPISYKIFDDSGMKARTSSHHCSDRSFRWYFKRKTVTIKRSKTQRVYIGPLDLLKLKGKNSPRFH